MGSFSIYLHNTVCPSHRILVETTMLTSICFTLSKVSLAPGCQNFMPSKFLCFVCVLNLNSHYFHTIGDKLIHPIVGVYMPIIRIPVIKCWDEFMANISSWSTLAHMLNYVYSQNATKVSIRNSPVTRFLLLELSFPPVPPGGFFQGNQPRKTFEKLEK